MRALNVFSEQGTLIAGYASRMGEAIIRRRAELEVRAARAEAELSIKARSEFLANMNHELRTPLNAIIGFATMLRDMENYELNEDQKRNYAEYILQSADLLLGHINTLLEVAALESGNVELHGAVFDCSAALAAAVKRAKIRADAAGATIAHRDQGQSALAWGDSERIGQALDHLLQIAVKACEKGGHIVVRSRVDKEGRAEIAVRDDGAGYDAEELQKGLEAFSQPHQGLDRSFAGPGVGYAVAKAFIEMQGGRFVVESRKGQGTIVRVVLPPPDAAKVLENNQASVQEENIELENADGAE